MHPLTPPKDSHFCQIWGSSTPLLHFDRMTSLYNLMGQRLEVLQALVTNCQTALFKFSSSSGFSGLSGSAPVFHDRLFVQLKCFNNCTLTSYQRIKNLKTTCSTCTAGLFLQWLLCCWYTQHHGWIFGFALSQKSSSIFTGPLLLEL